MVYVSKDNHTRALGEAVAAGAGSHMGASVRLREVDEASVADVFWADAVVLGSPTYNAAVHPRLQAFVNTWPLRDQRLRGKVGGSFVTSGGSTAGHELVLASLHASLQIFGFVVAAGPTWLTAFGAYAIDAEPRATLTGFDPNYFLEGGRRYGATVARLAQRLKD